MLARGKTRGISRHDKIRSVSFRDPNGNAIELATKLPGHDQAMDPARNGVRAKLRRWLADRRR